MAQTKPTAYLQGYAKEIAGKRFGYHSPLPQVNTALLIRGQADYVPIEWETEKIPADFAQPVATFIWMFGMDVVTTPSQFQLSINDRVWFDFNSASSSQLGNNRIYGIEGAILDFNVTMLDKYQDQMGFAILRIPATAATPGKPLKLKVSSKTKGNAAWYMTFKSGIQENIEVYQNKVVAKRNGALFHSVSIDFVHIGEDVPVMVKIGSEQAKAVLKAGFNKIEMLVPKELSRQERMAEIKIGTNTALKKKFTLEPVRPWEIYLVQHTHTDIGYTRPQTEILAEHLRYIDHALDFCDQTDSYPDDAKFRWTCETAWSVREYLRSRPQSQIDRLLKRIREGRIEATGMFLNYSEIIDEGALVAQTKTLQMLKNMGINVTTAMQNDVNGIAWCMVDYYDHTDVRYLTMGLHAHRAQKPFDKPTAFWWKSPAGNRLLAYRSEHYQHANALSLTTGQQDVFRNNLSQYLDGLEKNGYPYDKISLQFSGYVTDNAPPSTTACDIIRDWNDKYEWPKLRSALVREFMWYLDEQHAKDLPEHQVAWPDWWTDGVGSAANETKTARQAHAQLSTVTALMSLAKIQAIKLPPEMHDEVEKIYDNLLFYDEHTHGAAESVTDPLAQNTVNQWGMKAAYAWEANKQVHILEEKILAFLEPTMPACNQSTIAVYNTLNWPRTGMVELFIQYSVIPEGADFTILDAENLVVPAQCIEQRMEGAYYNLWVQNIPPLGYKMLKIILGQPPAPEPAINLSFPLENDFYRIEIDTKKGVISQVFDKELNVNLLDEADSLTMGQTIYEQLSNRHDLERLTNTTRDTVYRPLQLSRSVLQSLQMVDQKPGNIYHSIFLKGELPVCADARGVSVEIRLYHFKKMITLHYRLFKLPVTTPEGLYVSFPFKLPDGRLRFEVQGGVVYPGINQLEGSSSDWNTIQNFASVANKDAQIVFVSPEIPLVQFDNLNIGRYYYRLKPKTNHLFSWVLNNYWVTNFKASQEGELRWNYYITSKSDPSIAFASRFGWGARTPLPARVMMADAQASGTTLVSKSFLPLDIANLLLVQVTPSLDNQGVILHLRETDGNHVSLNIDEIVRQLGAKSASEVNVLEEKLSDVSGKLWFDHFETKFLKFIFQED